MACGFLEIAGTPAVLAAQEAMGSARVWTGRDHDRPSDVMGERERAFVADRDSFYMATVSETGWPYVQHRGGPRGFLKVLDERRLAFADYRGNRQYISLGNLTGSGRACLILVDYTRRARLKIYAHVEAVALDADPALTELVMSPDYKAKPERIFVLRVEAFDWNCPQHIAPRFTEAEIAVAVRPLHERLEELEAENARLRDQLRERLGLSQ